MLLKERKFSQHALNLIADLRGIPEEAVEVPRGKPLVPFATAMYQVFQRRLPSGEKTENLSIIASYWNDWFQGTDFAGCKPDRLDRWHCLWLKVPNAIVRQKLQFKASMLLDTLRKMSPVKIETIKFTL